MQHHQTSFTTDTKGTSLGKKHKTRERPTKIKPKPIKKNALGTQYIRVNYTYLLLK